MRLGLIVEPQHAVAILAFAHWADPSLENREVNQDIQPGLFLNYAANLTLSPVFQNFFRWPAVLHAAGNQSEYQ